MRCPDSGKSLLPIRGCKAMVRACIAHSHELRLSIFLSLAVRILKGLALLDANWWAAARISALEASFGWVLGRFHRLVFSEKTVVRSCQWYWKELPTHDELAFGGGSLAAGQPIKTLANFPGVLKCGRVLRPRLNCARKLPSSVRRLL